MTQTKLKKNPNVVKKRVPLKTKNTDPILGCMKGSGMIIGDIISPIDVEWNAEKGLF